MNIKWLQTILDLSINHMNCIKKFSKVICFCHRSIRNFRTRQSCPHNETMTVSRENSQFEAWRLSEDEDDSSHYNERRQQKSLKRFKRSDVDSAPGICVRLTLELECKAKGLKLSRKLFFPCNWTLGNRTREISHSNPIKFTVIKYLYLRVYMS